MREHHDTVVIGGGQAGLAISAVLEQRGREHVVLERRQVGEPGPFQRPRIPPFSQEVARSVLQTDPTRYRRPEDQAPRAPVLDSRGRPIQQRGVTEVPGLYFLGLHWMHTFKSGLLAGVAATRSTSASTWISCRGIDDDGIRQSKSASGCPPEAPGETADPASRPRQRNGGTFGRSDV